MTRRRRKGHGSIWRRPDGHWVGAVTIRTPLGRPARRYFYAATQREAHARVLEALRVLEAGGTLGDDRLTIGQLLAQWLEHVRPTVRPRTWRSYEGIVRVHLAPTLGHLRLRHLRPDHVERLLGEQHDAGLSPRTCAYLRVVLRCALNLAVKWQLVSRNAAALANPPRLARPQIPALTPDQARHFLTFLQSRQHRLYPLVAVAVSCGLRQGEILGLRWQDLDLARGRLCVTHALERVGRGWRLVEPKSMTSRRTIHLPEPLVAILRAHRRAQLEQRLAAGARWQEHDFVFTARHGQPLEGCKLNATVKALLRDAGLPVLHFHALRRSAATLLLAQGVPARTVAEILGHSDVRLTLNTYAHVVEPLHQDAADRVAKVLFGGVPKTDT
jgi:integrase